MAFQNDIERMLTPYWSREAMIRFMPSERTIALFSAMSNGSLTICVQADAQPAAQRCNWPPAPKGGDFSFIRSHLPKAAITDGSWTVRDQCGRGETRVTRMSAPGPKRHLVRCKDISDVGGEADMPTSLKRRD
jgi:hypothetical protein